MSLYYPLTPIEKLCPDCSGYSSGWKLCKTCDGIGRVFIEGAPSFGCKLTLEDCEPGQEVTLGTGDRGRVLSHCQRGTPTTEVILFDPMYEDWQETSTRYPSSTGVVIVLSTAWHRIPVRGRGEDVIDPLKRTKA